jgi:hypothetical protein
MEITSHPKSVGLKIHTSNLLLQGFDRFLYLHQTDSGGAGKHLLSNESCTLQFSDVA